MSENLWQEALRRTRRGPFGQLAGLFGTNRLDPAFWDGLEATLVGADVGVNTTLELVDDLRAAARERGWDRPIEVHRSLRDQLEGRLDAGGPEKLIGRPHLITLVGVNGSGKTTSAARLAHRWQAGSATVMMAAADTYRAAAQEQLESWSERLGVPLVRGEPGGDPGAVVYKAGQAARSGERDVLIVDTSGRMHTSHNLMAELQKIHRVAGKVVEGAPHEVLLVLDATTGQNGLSQAQAFVKTVPVTGVILAKLDSSARGGVAVAVCQQLGLPIRYVGLGERIGDFARFDAGAFLDGLLATDPASVAARQDFLEREN